MRKGFGFHDRHSPFRFNPATLFIGGAVQGVLYDPSDLSTMFSDTAGTTPVAMPGSGAAVSVGRILDKSGNGNHAISYNSTTARPELSARVNLLSATATLSTQSVVTTSTTHRLRFTGTGSITVSGTATGTFAAGTHSIACSFGTLTLTVSGTVTNADLRPANIGLSLPAYQDVTDSTTYDTTGFPSYLRFNGTSTGMYTAATINMSSTAQMTLFTGVRTLNNTSYPFVAEFSPSVNTNNGSFALLATDGTTSNSPAWSSSSRGTTAVGVATPLTYTPPRTDILTVVGDISAPQITLRANGAQVATSSASQGTGNYGTHRLNIGTRNAEGTPLAGQYLNGNLYGLIVLGAQATDWQIWAAEQWMAQRTGISF